MSEEKNKLEKVRISKTFSFDMAHSLYNHDGACRHIHGHTYKLDIVLSGMPMQRKGHPKDGMVMDFKDLKNIVKKEVIGVFDHALVLNDRYKEKYSDLLEDDFGKILFVPFQPTCENLLLEIKNRIKSGLSSDLELHSVRLHETPTSFAEME